MLFKHTIIATIGLLSMVGSVSADVCLPGFGNNQHGNCLRCPAGTYSPGGSGVVCSDCPPGSGINPGAISPLTCGQCPAGYYTNGHGQGCSKCPAGKFNSFPGATGCCVCCDGFHSTNARTSCEPCATGFHSDAGSQSCQPDQRGHVYPKTTSCTMQGKNTCPATTPTGPTGMPMKKRAFHCTRSYTACPHFSGRGGWDCVDTKNDPEMCGGCVEADGTGEGKDCYSLPGVSTVSCNKGKCLIGACRKGFTKSEDGESCIAYHTESNPSSFPNVVAQGSRRARRAML